jgi:Fe-S-cluster-containing dehydrogenase component
MSINRRQFLGGMAAGGAAVAAVATPPEAEAEPFMRDAKARPDEALGLLYDSTLCIGCKACVAGCKAANGMPPEVPAVHAGWNDGTWDTAKDLSGSTLNIIKVYMHGTVEQKDRAENGFAFIKRQCLHCVDPSCMSACPVSAMIKDPVTGIVSHDVDRCIGCRYCVYACPFGVPKYEYDNPFGKIQKCQLCNHLLPEGKLPGCVETCPTGATLFGRYADLQREAQRRLQLKPGDTYEYPRGNLSGRIEDRYPSHEKVIAAEYLQHVYGERVLGGTQTLYLSAVPFDKLGLPYQEDSFGRPIPDYAYARLTEGVQHFLYTGMIAPAVVLTGLILLARRNFDKHHHEAEEDGGDEQSEGGK